jgi:all-trans-retinol 13,14-reductase
MFIEICLLTTIIYLLFNFYEIKIIPSKFCRRNTLPKGLKKSVWSGTRDIRNIERDGYSKKKINENWDVIVIGSGIGGLTTAALLSKVGYKVLVLEQHYIAGGCCHTFEEGGFEFDTGVHYVGEIEKIQPILDLITENKINWTKLGNTKHDKSGIYDKIFINDSKFEMKSGRHNLIMNLFQKFPLESENILRYFNLIRKLSDNPMYFKLKVVKNPLIRRIVKCFLRKTHYKYASQSTYEVISEEITQNKELQAILMSQFGDYAGSPENVSFAMHAGMVNHYLEGGYYPEGGPGNIVRQIIPTILKSGGRVLVRRAVKEILTEDGEARGVEMDNGDIIYCHNIISNVGIRNTLTKLLPYNNLKLNKFIKQQPIPVSYFYVFVGLEGTTTNINPLLNLPSYNIWSHPHGDYAKLVQDFSADPLTNPMPLFIAFPSAKDDSWHERFPNKSTAIVLTMISHETFQKWENTTFNRRGEEYNRFKQQIGDRLLKEGLFKYFPHLQQHIKYHCCGTPLTNKFYLGSPFGECLGSSHNPTRFTTDLIRPETGYKGIYLTGQDICTGGFSGAIFGAVIATHSFLGYGTTMDILRNRDFIKELAHFKP